jgi:hypothetical protein
MTATQKEICEVVERWTTRDQTHGTKTYACGFRRPAQDKSGNAACTQATVLLLVDGLAKGALGWSSSCATAEKLACIVLYSSHLLCYE